MAKNKTSYACTACGTTHARWIGQCPDCQAWNTIQEEVPVLSFGATGGLGAALAKAKPVKLTNLQGADLKEEERTSSGFSEFDRVLGGGFVAGSAILVGGDPGIGKSTLLLQTAATLSKQNTVLYLSGEESARQVQLRAQRLGLSAEKLAIANVNTLEVVLATMKAARPDFVIIDSIQTLYAESCDSAPGTVSQVRLCAHELTQAAKQTGCVVLFVGHVTKEGVLAGPRVLEHMVDTVLYFEGDDAHSFRLLRSFKNRFGATNEVGVFEMRDKGLQEVLNPSALFLESRPAEAPGSVVMPAMNGTRPVLMEVQSLVTTTPFAQPRRTVLGVDQGRVAMIIAILDKHAGFNLASHDIFINVTGGMKVTEPAADLAIAGSLVSSLLNRVIPPRHTLFGETGLSGEVRPVSHTEARLRECEKLGFTNVLCPALPKDVTSPQGMNHEALNKIGMIRAHLFK